MERLISPALQRPLSSDVYDRLAMYMALLYRWNGRMNLTAVRDPQLFARLHLAECLLSAQLVPAEVRTAMDYGSGAGLPGIPMAIACPQISFTLAESQGKKAAFLREAVRELRLKNVTVFHGRVEDSGRDFLFDLVTLRAVDKMGQALRTAYGKILGSGWCFVLASGDDRSEIESLLHGLRWFDPVLVPGSSRRLILRGTKGEHA